MLLINNKQQANQFIRTTFEIQKFPLFLKRFWGSVLFLHDLKSFYKTFILVFRLVSTSFFSKLPWQTSLQMILVRKQSTFFIIYSLKLRLQRYMKPEKNKMTWDFIFYYLLLKFIVRIEVVEIAHNISKIEYLVIYNWRGI